LFLFNCRIQKKKEEKEKGKEKEKEKKRKKKRIQRSILKRAMKFTVIQL
jgi:hypothetical protein